MRLSLDDVVNDVTGVPSPVRLQDLSAAAQAAREALEKAVWRAGNPHEPMDELMT